MGTGTRPGHPAGQQVEESTVSLEEIVAEQLCELYGWPIERVQDSAALIAEAVRREKA